MAFNNIDFTPQAATTKWDDIEVSPVWEDPENPGVCEVCDEGQETFWSVYLHQVEGGAYCVADVPTKELAHQLAELLKNAAQTLSQPNYLNK